MNPEVAISPERTHHSLSETFAIGSRLAFGLGKIARHIEDDFGDNGSVVFELAPADIETSPQTVTPETTVQSIRYMYEWRDDDGQISEPCLEVTLAGEDDRVNKVVSFYKDHNTERISVEASFVLTDEQERGALFSDEEVDEILSNYQNGTSDPRLDVLAQYIDCEQVVDRSASPADIDEVYRELQKLGDRHKV